MPFSPIGEKLESRKSPCLLIETAFFASLSVDLGYNLQCFSLIVQRNQLVATQRQLRVGLPFIITKLHLVHIRREDLHHCADFTTLELAFWQVLKQRYGVKQFNLSLWHYRF